MTACKDVQDVNLGKKAVSAALAGTLAVGMVPAVALAAPADDAAADDGIESLALSTDDDVAGGKVTGATLNGVAVSNPAKITVSIADFDTASPYALKNFVINQITTKAGVVLNLTKDNTLITLDPNADGNSQLTGVPAAGSLSAQIKLQNLTGAMGKYNGATLDITLNVVGAPLTGTVAYVAGDKGNSNFVYDFGDTISPDFYLNGELLKPFVPKGTTVDGATATEDSGDYTVAYYDKDGNAVTNITNAGTYTAVLTGKLTYDKSKVSVPITVQKLDLAKANIVVGKGASGVEVKTINGVQWATANTAVPMTVTVVGPDGTANSGQIGEYKVTVAPQSSTNANVTGSQTVAYNLTTGEADFQYNGAVIPSTGQWSTDTKTNLPVYTYVAGESGTAAFNYELLTAVEDGTSTKIDDVTYAVTDESGKAASLSDLSKPGVWKVTATVDAKATEYAWGGSQTVIVKNYAGKVTGNDIIVKQDGAVVRAPLFPYTGEDIVGQLDITVNCGKKTLTNGVDYEYKITNRKGVEVDSLVNADVYTITLTSETYQMPTNPDDTVTVTISPVIVSNIRAVGTVDNNGTQVLPYTSEVITPAYEYTEDGKTWETLPADQYSVAYTGTGAELKEAGTYTATFTSVPAEGYAQGNYDFATKLSGGIPVTVAKVQGRFKDVPATAWYYDAVQEATAPKTVVAVGSTPATGDYLDNPYMNGYSGANFFGPNDQIKRGDVAVVLFNMAGGDISGVTDNSYNETYGYDTGFSDVNGKAYWAQAIAWAKTLNVVSGYTETTFGPNDYVTREQFAAMLANYAKATGQSIAVEDIDAALASMPDADKVANWAKPSVAWAVSNHYMGNGGTIAPKSTITRAEVAAMAINYQPRTVK